MRTILCVLALTISVGCSEKPISESTAQPDAIDAGTQQLNPVTAADRESFGAVWRNADDGARQKMADLSKVHPLFNGASKKVVEEALGSPSFSGVDKFGEDTMKYELGAMPEDIGGGQYHLTFVFENAIVIRVMGNSMTF